MHSVYANPRYWVTGILLGAFWVFHKVFPYQFKVKALQLLGRLAFRIGGTRRHVADVNLSICYPQMSSADREKMVCRNFEHFSVSMLEIAISWWGKDDGRLDSISFTGTENLDRAIAQGNGVILVGAHFATLELGAALVRKHIGENVPLHIVHREQKNALINAHMLRGRARHVESYINNKNIRQIVKTVRSKAIIWYAPDQDNGIRSSISAPFFGHPAATLTTTSTLAGISGAAVIMMGSYRNSDNSGYCVKFYPSLENFPSGDELQDATRVNQMIETAISVAPDQYMWAHRRFKFQSGLAKSELYRQSKR